MIAPTRLGRERDRRNGRPPASRRTVPVRRVGFRARLGSARSAAQVMHPLPGTPPPASGRRLLVRMSWITAALARDHGTTGSSYLRSAANSPSAAKRRRGLSN